MTQLLIARHGNTFAAGETPRRVGKHTDLPLVESGLAQGKMLGAYLLQEALLPDRVFCSRLQRTRQTAEQALQQAGHGVEIIARDMFDEIDYGPDENKTEDEVIARIGEEAIRLWNEAVIVPEGWRVDATAVTAQWETFADEMLAQYVGERVLVVTSNGVARFAPVLTGDEAAFDAVHARKMHTGAVSCLEYNAATGQWDVVFWNRKPKDYV